MTIDAILKSRTNITSSLNILLVQTGRIRFPFPTTRRDTVLRRLEEMDAESHETLEALAPRVHQILTLEGCGLSETELYMLGQRVRCALDFLTRLAAAQPSPGWFCAETDFLEDEDCFLFRGLWREFGQQWLANLAWKLARGLDC